MGVLERGERGDDNETSLKEGGLIEMSTTVLPFAMLAPSLDILTSFIVTAVSTVTIFVAAIFIAAIPTGLLVVVAVAVPFPTRALLVQR